MSIYVVGSTKNLFPELDEGREKFLVDVPHDGNNIDKLNPWYCELTALYYLWKNSTAGVVGLEHYRRFFASPSCSGNQNMRMTKDDAMNMLSKSDIIMCKYRHKPGYSAYQWFTEAKKGADLHKFYDVLNQSEPGLGNRFDEYLKRRELKQCNMFVTHKPIIDQYCEWLFPKLEMFDKQVGLTEANKRIDGYFGEHIFGLWVEMMKLRVFVNKKIEMHFMEMSGSKL